MEKSKAIVNMKDWEINCYDGKYSLSGLADNHPGLGKNFRIEGTSDLENYEFEKDILTYETQNTIYRCPLKYVHRIKDTDNECPLNLMDYLRRVEEECRNKIPKDQLHKIMDVASRLDCNPDMEDEFTLYFLEISNEGQKELEADKDDENQRLIEMAELNENSLYIEIFSSKESAAGAYNIQGHKGNIYGRKYSGMFSGTIKYESQDLKAAREDFYFKFGYYLNDDAGESIVPYECTKNIKLVVIKNIGSEDFTIEGKIIKPGEIAELKREKFTMLMDEFWENVGETSSL